MNVQRFLSSVVPRKAVAGVSKTKNVKERKAVWISWMTKRSNDRSKGTPARLAVCDLTQLERQKSRELARQNVRLPNVSLTISHHSRVQMLDSLIAKA